MTEKSQQNSNVVTEYYTAQDVLATSFIMVSKTLIFAKKYREPASYQCKDGTTMNFKMLSFDARFLYGVYKDRYSISVSNLQNGNTSFVDKQRRVFCYFTNDEVRFYTGWGLSKISRIKKELAAYNLMAEEAQGFNKANRIYILKSPDDLEILTAHDYKNFHEKSEKDRQDKKSDKKRKELSSLLNKGNPISVLPGKQRESQNGIPGNTDLELQEIPNRDGSNIKSININDDDENKREETDTETQQFEKSLQEVAKSELRTIFDTLAASLNNQDDIEATLYVDMKHDTKTVAKDKHVTQTINYVDVSGKAMPNVKPVVESLKFTDKQTVEVEREKQHELNDELKYIKGGKVVTTIQEKEYQMTEINSQMDIKKAPELTQELLSSDGGTFNRNPSSLSDDITKVALQPVEQAQPAFLTDDLLHFNIKNSKIKVRKEGYFPIKENELRKLNLIAPSLQKTAQFYAQNLSGTTVNYIYKDGSDYSNMPTYIRNYIDHPGSYEDIAGINIREKPTTEQIRSSIIFMIELNKIN